MKYRKKPLVIEAIQFDGTQASINKMIEAWGEEFSNIYRFYGGGLLEMYVKSMDDLIDIDASVWINSSVWIIKGIEGELYPCVDSIFKESYDEVEE